MSRPWFALEIETRCTRSCVYCYNCWKSPGARPSEPLPLRDLAALLRRLSEQACPSGVTLTGGEPLLRDDLEEIAAECSRLFPVVTLSTTGDGLDRARASRLTAAGVLHYEAALPSADPGICEELCGTDGEASRRAMATLSRMGAFVTASVLLSSRTAPGLRETVLLASACGARAVVLNPFLPTGAGAGRPDLAMEPAGLCSAALTASEASSMSGIPVYFGTAIRRCEVPAGALEGCPSGPCICGSGKWAVGPSGELRPCEQSPRELGNLLSASFRDLERCASAVSFRAVPAACSSCVSLPGCGGGCRPVRSLR